MTILDRTYILLAPGKIIVHHRNSKDSFVFPNRHRGQRANLQLQIHCFLLNQGWKRSIVNSSNSGTYFGDDLPAGQQLGDMAAVLNACSSGFWKDK